MRVRPEILPPPPLPVAARAFRALAIATIVFLVGARHLYFARAEWPHGIEAWLQGLMRVETLSALVAITVDVLAVAGTLWIVLPLLVVRILLRRRWLFRRDGGVLVASPLVHSLLWLIAMVNQVWLDVNPQMAAICLLSLPLLLLSPRGPARPQAVWFAGVFGVALLACRDLPERLCVLGFALAMAALVRLPPTVFGRRDRLIVALHLTTVAQLCAGLLPLFLPTHGGTRVGDGMAYSYCESTRRGLIFASVPGCGTWSDKLHECKQGAIDVIQAHEPTRVRRYPIMTEAFHGRLEQLVCLDDTVQVSMNRTVRDGTLLMESALEFDMDEPTRTRPYLLGEPGGHRIEYDPRDDTLYYLGDDIPLLVRLDRRTGRKARFWKEGPAAARIVSGAISARRRTLFTIGVETPALEWALGDLSPVARYANAGGTELSVDDEMDRLFITGFFGLEVIDLKTGRTVLRRLLGGIPRKPIIDERNGVVYVPNLLGGKLHVLDRETLTEIGRLPLGAGSRYPYVSRDGRFLFAGNQRAHFVWSAAELVKSLRERR